MTSSPAFSPDHLTISASCFRFNVYDADAFVPCRYHLLRRGNELTPSDATGTDAPGMDTNSTNSSNATSTNATGYVSDSLPGSSGRWQLEEDGSGLEGAGRMMVEVDNLNQLYSMYNLLQVGLEGRGWQEGVSRDVSVHLAN
jgi:hypothetical protein